MQKHKHDPVVDCDGEPLTIGTLVRFDAYDATDHYPAQPESFAVVIAISDWDGDKDDEGRDIGWPPRVTVRYTDDGVEEKWTTMRGWYDDEDQADELEVAFHGPLLPGLAKLTYAPICTNCGGPRGYPSAHAVGCPNR